MNDRHPDRHLPGLRNPEPWMTDALCARTDPDLFFEASTDRYHARPDGTRESIAKSVCANCTVAAECLEYAIANDERYGIWGGLTTRERVAHKRGRTA